MWYEIRKVTETLKFGSVWFLGAVRELCSVEFLGLCTVLLPSFLASVGFFFGKTVTPWYFYGVVVIMLCGACLVNWRRGMAYLLLLVLCATMTAFTFSYVGCDAQNYHFPMQYLLRHGWNPVYDSTVEKFLAIAGDAQLAIYHTLFLPKFSSLCGAIVASAFGLFSGDGFLGYILIWCLFVTSVKFAKRYWMANKLLSFLFAAGLTFSTKITSFLAGQVDYSTYASFCIAALSLIMYVRERRIGELAVFFASGCVCMSSKSTGVLCCFVLVVMTLPLLIRRIEYRRTLILLGIAVAIVGASPLLTAWIQYGSPFYPSMTFDPRVRVVDITGDFTGNADALSMGYLSRVCYAWVSPKLTVGLIRILGANPNFNPVFSVCGGVAGFGMWFNVLLAASVFLLVVARKNLVTFLCIIIFISSNFAPLKYIGHGRYFPQIWAIFPLAVMNFVCVGESCVCKCGWSRIVRNCFSSGFCVVLLCLAFLSFTRTVAYQCRMMVQERYRQDLIASFSPDRPVRVDGWGYRFTNVARFRQAGVRLVRSEDGQVDTVMQKDSALPCFDTHPEVYDDLNRRFPVCDSIRTLMCNFKWADVVENLPHVLWDRGDR